MQLDPLQRLLSYAFFLENYGKRPEAALAVQNSHWHFRLKTQVNRFSGLNSNVLQVAEHDWVSNCTQNFSQEQVKSFLKEAGA